MQTDISKKNWLLIWVLGLAGMRRPSILCACARRDIQAEMKQQRAILKEAYLRAAPASFLQLSFLCLR